MLRCFCEDPLPLDSEDISATKCGHIFHTSCLMQWLNIKNLCPSCRSTVTRSDHFRLFPSLADEPQESEAVIQQTLLNLERTQEELNTVTDLCKKKDETIETLKKTMTKDRYEEDTKALKDLLNIYDGDDMDMLFDDKEFFYHTINNWRKKNWI